MRLSSQLNLGFLLLAVLPPAGMTVYSYVSSERAYRGAVEAEGHRLTQEMSSRLEQAVLELSSRIQAMREEAAAQEMSAFQQARASALAAAEAAELRSLLKSVLSTTKREENQILFARDRDQALYAAEPADLALLYGLKLAPAPPGQKITAANPSDWVVATQEDAPSGVTVGVARPLGAPIQEIRRTALRNLAYGFAMVAIALIGIRPLSKRLTRHLDALTEGVERLGSGESDVQVEVPKGAEEIERLAKTFNRMARDLRSQQDRLLTDERLHRELEISRRIQSELLPPRAARLPFAEVAGLSIPAREVGGDFFNYFALSETDMAVLVGDVSGKGVPAAILMASLQATLSARLPLERDLARLAETLDRQLASADARALYATLFIGVLSGTERSLRYVSAGHNTQILLRGPTGTEHLESTGRPLGLLPGGGYEERHLGLEPGNALLLFTDGLLDAENAGGQAFGMHRVETVAASRADAPVDLILSGLGEALAAHRGVTEAGDDATIVALKVSAETARGALR
jgi:serine phosphatase RsbU (regulator of sigma subunit)